MWQHLLCFSRREEGSPASVSVLLTLRAPSKRVARRNPQYGSNEGTYRKMQGLLQVCVVLLTLSTVNKGVGKYFRNVGGIILT